jgi:hypothetical protein
MLSEIPKSARFMHLSERAETDDSRHYLSGKSAGIDIKRVLRTHFSSALLLRC